MKGGFIMDGKTSGSQHEYLSGFRYFENAESLYERLRDRSRSSLQAQKKRKEENRQGRASMLIQTEDYIEGKHTLMRMSLGTALLVLFYFTISRLIMIRRT